MIDEIMEATSHKNYDRIDLGTGYTGSYLDKN